LFLHDLTRLAPPDSARSDTEIAARLPTTVPVVHVFNKADQLDTAQVEAQVAAARSPVGHGLALSARTGAGLDALRRLLLEQAGWHAAPEGVFIARQRHVQALRQAGDHLEWRSEEHTSELQSR